MVFGVAQFNSHLYLP